ncbi:hypothetical protein AB8O64_28585 [Streptomyces sp. QH1-20]|uniref:hypothetical protein n=1 Tax=Streptomyces sp. QH1-20 TaxID=3240934 RepID=UPI0035196F78
MSPWRAWKNIVAAAAASLTLALPSVPATAEPLSAKPSIAASGYLNLHQCAYWNANLGDYLTNMVPTPGEPAFNSGTKVSSSADTQVACGTGGYGWTLNTGFSRVYSINLG